MNKSKTTFFSLVFSLLFFIKVLELTPFFAAGFAGFTQSFRFEELILSLFSSLAAAVAGYWAAKPLIRYNRTHPQKKVTSRLLLILYFLAGCLFSFLLSILLWDHILMISYSSVLFTICWLRFAKYTQSEYFGKYSTTEYITGSVFYIVITLAVVIAKQHFDFPFTFSTRSFVFAYLVYTCGSAILLNQANIDTMMERRHHDLRSLPPSIRRYSLRVIALLFLLLSLGFLFQNQILWALDKLGSLLLMGIRGLIAVFLFISKLFSSPESASSGEPVAGGQEQFPTVETNSSIFSEILVWVLFLAVVVFIIVKIHKPFINWLKKLFMKIPVFTIMESEDYTDQVKELNKDLIEKNLTEAQKRRKLKKEYRLWLNTRDSSVKVRTGYKLVRDTMLYRKMDIQKQDTAREVTQKMEQSSPGLLFDKETDLYEQVRYHLKEPSPEQTRGFSDAVSKIIANKKNKPSG